MNPKQDKGKQVGFSGWQGVLNYISGTDEKNLFVEALKEDCEYVIPAAFDKSKLIFAISIDETECWLIPFVDLNKKNCENIDRCVNLVNKSIKKQSLFIDPNNKIRRNKRKGILTTTNLKGNAPTY